MQPEFLTNTPLKAEYDKVAPDKTQWNAFLTGMIEFDKKDFNLGDDKIKNIKSPTLLISGDNDGVDKAILMHTYKALGGLTFSDMTGIPKSQLAIVPGTGHVSLMMDQENIYKLVSRFLQ
jgi:pimeloyl-ACP methyl ester carboxylesterase